MSVPPSNPYGTPTAASSMSGFSSGQMRSMRLKRLDPLSCGKMLGALYVFIGLLMSVFMIAITVLGVAGAGGNNIAAGLAGGVIGAVFMPIFYGVIGFIGGLIMAFLYNLCASVIGGIEMQFEE
ncbi:hypothetical protein FHS27_000363 [Rhodopirellula rubra]|uniref:DUF3566 domain-containing protein n=1 Tax=Aporhodopirellula rubra TaxID=980271 RepID=A0A7W5DU45_9BACT|nr:DUF3566 domain-containing protein [Aporhodopirellula rubra]MBB3204599.1 hypothetical protein [Aporhodopirellula rubra]